MIHFKKITLNQLICLVILTQVGVSVLSIPFEESRNSGYDAWMSILIAGIISQIEILIIYFLAKRYPDRPFQQYVYSIIGRPLGFVINLIIALYCAESSLMVAISYSDVLNRWVLFETPWLVLIGLTFAVAAYIASSTLRSIATITQTILCMFLFCVVIIFTSGFGKGDWRHFFPIGSHGFGAILKDTIPSFWAYAGFELLLYVFPYVKYKKKNDVLIAMTIANGITTLFYLCITVIVLYNFSEHQLNFIHEPMVFILRKFRWPIVQSLDILFMAIWFSVTIVTVYVYLFLSARYLAYLSKKESRNHSLLVWIVAIICFLVGLFFSDVQSIEKFAKYHNALTLIIIITIPTLLLLISIVREKVARK